MSSKKEALLERLRKQRSAEEAIDVDKLRGEWLASLEELMSRLREWLSTAEKEGLFNLAAERVIRKEDRLGEYEAPALRIETPKGDIIEITPKARYVVGAYGRVDLESPPNKAILVQDSPGHWQFARLAPQGSTYSDLTEETFWEALGELLP